MKTDVEKLNLALEKLREVGLVLKNMNDNDGFDTIELAYMNSAFDGFTKFKEVLLDIKACRMEEFTKLKEDHE